MCRKAHSYLIEGEKVKDKYNPLPFRMLMAC
jgi:hypothetical protein